MQNTADRLFEDLRQRRQDAWVEPMHRVLDIVQLAAGIDAARQAQRRAEDLKETEGPMWWTPSDLLTGDLRDAFRRWVKAGWMMLPPPPSDVLPIPEIEAAVWAAARKRWTEDGNANALLQLSCLRAYREVHGDGHRTGRRHLSPNHAPE